MAIAKTKKRTSKVTIKKSASKPIAKKSMGKSTGRPTPTKPVGKPFKKAAVNENRNVKTVTFNKAELKKVQAYLKANNIPGLKAFIMNAMAEANVKKNKSSEASDTNTKESVSAKVAA